MAAKESATAAKIRAAMDKEKDPKRKQALRDKLIKIRADEGLPNNLRAGDKGYSPHAETPEEKAKREAAAVQETIGVDPTGAKTIADSMFGEGSLGRVSTGFNPDGTRIAENQGILDRLKGTQDAYDKSGARSGDQQSILDMYKSRLGGYDTPTMQAFREQQGREGKTLLATQLAQQEKTNARNGVRGPAAARFAQIANQNFVNAGLRNEQDLFAKNEDVKGQRLGEYNNALTGAEGTEYAKTRQAGADYAGRLDTTRADELARGQYNLGQVAGEKAGQYSTYFGALNLASGNKNTAEQNALSKEALEIMKKQVNQRGGASA